MELKESGSSKIITKDGRIFNTENVTKEKKVISQTFLNMTVGAGDNENLTLADIESKSII